MDKLKLLDDLKEHMEGLQVKDLLDLIAKAKAPKEMEEMPGKGIKVEKIEVLGKKKPGMGLETPEEEVMEGMPHAEPDGDEEELSEDEIKALLSKLIK